MLNLELNGIKIPQTRLSNHILTPRQRTFLLCNDKMTSSKGGKTGHYSESGEEPEIQPYYRIPHAHEAHLAMVRTIGDY